MKIYSCFPNGKTKVLTMSYDDGKLADERLVAIFNKYGIKGTFNLNYGQMERPERIDRDKIKALYAGHEIATHTMTHPTISRCPMTEAAKEILADRDRQTAGPTAPACGLTLIGYEFLTEEGND